MTNDNMTTQADATIEAIETIRQLSQNQQKQENDSKEVKQLRERVQELEERCEEYEAHISQLASEQEKTDLEGDIGFEDVEVPDEEEEREEEEDDVFFKNIPPKEVSMEIRRNAVKQYLKDLREREGKFETKTVYKVAEEVFGSSPNNSRDPNYGAVYNTLNDHPEFEAVEGNESGIQKGFRLSPKIKVN